MMYEMMMKNHKRLNHLEKELTKLERNTTLAKDKKV